MVPESSNQLAKQSVEARRLQLQKLLESLAVSEDEPGSLETQQPLVIDAAFEDTKNIQRNPQPQDTHKLSKQALGLSESSQVEIHIHTNSEGSRGLLEAAIGLLMSILFLAGGYALLISIGYWDMQLKKPQETQQPGIVQP